MIHYQCEEVSCETFQVVLYRKSKQEKEARFYSLYDKVWREDVLWEAWRQVKANHGAPSIGGTVVPGF